MCEYCDDKKTIEPDNNRPIVDCPLCEFVNNQEPLGEEFEKVLYENLTNLYVV